MYTKTIIQYSHSTHALMFGGGLAYVVSNGYWHHTPFLLISPTAYAGYQAFMNLRPIQGIMPGEPMTSQFTLGESRLDFKFSPDSHKSVRDGEV